MWTRFVGMLMAGVVINSLLSQVSADLLHWDGSASALWGNANNWTNLTPFAANVVPDGDDFAFVGTATVGASQVVLSADVNGVDGLLVSNGHLVNTDGFLLMVNDGSNTAETLITGAGSAIWVEENAIAAGNRSFDTDVLRIEQSGELSMRGGKAEIDNDAEIELGSFLVGNGLVSFTETSVVSVLENNGRIGLDNLGASGSPTLEITTAGGLLDLDGNGAGILDASVSGAGLLLIDGPLFDPFDGTIHVGSEDTIEFTHAWSLHGRLNLEGSVDPATLAGAETYVETGGIVDVADDSSAVISAPLTVSFGTVDVGRNAELRLENETIFGGGGPGQLLLDSNSHLVIAGETTIDHTGLEFDWDGSGETADTTVESGGTLTIHADDIETGGGSHHGDLTIQDGTVTINTTGQWSQAGPVELSNDLAQPGAPTLAGSPVQFSSGNLTVTGGAAKIDAEATFANGYGSIDVASDGKLNFLQNTTIRGGTWNVDGVVNLSDATTRISEPITMQGGVVDLDGNQEGGGSLVLHDSLTLEVDSIEDDHDSDRVDNAVIQINSGGQLNVHLPASSEGWIVADDSVLTLMGDAARTTPHLAGDRVALRGALETTSAPVRIAAEANFGSAGSTNLGDDLHMEADTTVKQGHVFTGAGTLINEATEVMALEDGARVDVDLMNLGTLQIGDLPGRAEVVDYQQDAAAVLEIELGGLTPGSDYDVLSVDNLMDLDGTLDVTFINSFLRPDGSVFDVLDFGTVAGTFSTLSLPAGIWDTSQLYVTGELMALPMAGDMNGDGVINFADLSGFGFALTDEATYAATYPGLDLVARCDVSGDGSCDFADITPFVDLLNGTSPTFGAVGFASSSAGMAVGVPEPSTAVMLIAAAVCWSGWTRRRCCRVRSGYRLSRLKAALQSAAGCR